MDGTKSLAALCEPPAIVTLERVNSAIMDQVDYSLLSFDMHHTALIFSISFARKKCGRKGSENRFPSLDPLMLAVGGAFLSSLHQDAFCCLFRYVS
jgi:hypothetical protein